MEITTKIYADDSITDQISWKIETSVYLSEEDKKQSLYSLIEQFKDSLEDMKNNLDTPFQQNVVEHIYYYGSKNDNT